MVGGQCIGQVLIYIGAGSQFLTRRYRVNAGSDNELPNTNAGELSKESCLNRKSLLQYLCGFEVGLLKDQRL